MSSSPPLRLLGSSISSKVSQQYKHYRDRTDIVMAPHSILFEIHPCHLGLAGALHFYVYVYVVRTEGRTDRCMIHMRVITSGDVLLSDRHSTLLLPRRPAPMSLCGVLPLACLRARIHSILSLQDIVIGGPTTTNKCETLARTPLRLTNQRRASTPRRHRHLYMLGKTTWSEA